MGEELVVRLWRATDGGPWVASAHGGCELVGVARAETPWEASNSAYEIARWRLGQEAKIEWETLPWAAQREAHGITQGVCALLGASLEARRAIDAVRFDTLRRDAGAIMPECAHMLDGAAAARVTWSALLWRDERAASRALVYSETAGRSLRGFGRARALLVAAVNNGFPLRRRGVRLLRRAVRQMFAAARANGIRWEAPDTPRLPSM